MLKDVAKELGTRDAWYWARVVVIGALGLLLSRWLAVHTVQWIQALELPVYQFMSTAGPRAPETGHLAIVEITDEEFWKGELAGRRPAKRRYIASLVTSLCGAGASVVALDFDLRSPLPDGSLLNHPDYKDETDALAQAVQTAHRGCRVVLPRTLYCPHPPNGDCSQEPSVLDSYKFDPAQVSWGYINLPADARQIPLRRANVEHNHLDSFAQAIAIADSPERIDKLRAPEDFRFGSFMPVDMFRGGHVVFAAQQVLRDTPAAIAGKTVLVGGAWHAIEYGRGAVVDTHVSPVGSVPGVFLHANYAAALLDGRAYPQAPEALSAGLEVFVIVLLAILFARRVDWSRRWLQIAAVGVVLAVLSYVFLQNLGIFLEVLIPAALLLAHALLDEYLHMRKELVTLRQSSAQLETLRKEVEELKKAGAAKPAR